MATSKLKCMKEQPTDSNSVHRAMLALNNCGQPIDFQSLKQKWPTSVEKEIQCLKSNFVFSNRGGQIYLMILESLFTASHQFGLSMASSFFSPISSTC